MLFPQLELEAFSICAAQRLQRPKFCSIGFNRESLMSAERLVGLVPAQEDVGCVPRISKAQELFEGLRASDSHSPDRLAVSFSLTLLITKRLGVVDKHGTLTCWSLAKYAIRRLGGTAQCSKTALLPLHFLHESRCRHGAVNSLGCKTCFCHSAVTYNRSKV